METMAAVARTAVVVKSTPVNDEKRTGGAFPPVFLSAAYIAKVFFHGMIVASKMEIF